MTDSRQPTVVLVHGAFADASGYGGIIRELTRQGYEAIAPPNPLRSLSGDAATLSAVVDAIDGPVVLVGHSYGGAVISQASAGLANVTGLVYLAAFGLEAGESCASVQEPFPPPLLATTARPTPYDAPGAAGGPDLYISKDRFRETFCADVPVDQTDVMYATQRPLDRGGLEGSADLVPRLRARQRDPAGRGALHGRADEGDDRLGQRVAHGLHRAAGARSQLHREGAHHLSWRA
jgi:pimeloyl-ACP methyl ester carboxylesterase